MSKNHPHDNIYSILGKLEKLESKDKPAAPAPKTIYESVESQGSILKGLRDVSSTEQRLTRQFAESNTNEAVRVAGNTKGPIGHYSHMKHVAKDGSPEAQAHRDATAAMAKSARAAGSKLPFNKTTEPSGKLAHGGYNAMTKGVTPVRTNEDDHCTKCDCDPCECPTNEGEYMGRPAKYGVCVVGHNDGKPVKTFDNEADAKAYADKGVRIGGKLLQGSVHTIVGEATCNECGMYESECGCEHTNEDMSRAAKGYEKYGKKGMEALAKAGREGASEEELDTIRNKHDQYNEGKTEKTATGIKHTKTDFPGYPSDDLEDEDDKEDGEKDHGPKKGRPRKATTKNPRRDPNAEKKGRGRPKKEKSDSSDSKSSFKSHDPFGRVKKDAHKRASVAESMNQLADSFLQELSEGRIIDESGETLDHILNRFKHEVKSFEQGGELDEDLYHALFDYYFERGEIPYGTAKARDGDPYEWISDRLDLELGDKAYGSDPANAEMDETIDPTNPRDYEIPAFMRKAQGQAPLSRQDIVNKDRKAEFDYHQRAHGQPHPDSLKTELDELAKLAGLGEVSRGEYIKQQDAKAEKSGKDSFNAFGQLFNTDEVTEDPQPEFEGNEFSGELAKARAQHKDTFDVDGKEYPVKESEYGDTTVDNADEDKEEHANKPKPKYGSIKAITTQGDDLNRQKRQDPHTANKAANPLTTTPTLESQLAAEYESIKKSSK